jgi:hypothetical protein
MACELTRLGRSGNPQFEELLESTGSSMKHGGVRRTSVATLANITHRDSDILSGSLVFVGTRVPVRSLFDYLEGGESLDEFLH